MTTQLDLFNPQHDPEFLRWLVSPVGTPAPWVVRERQRPKRKAA